MSESNQFLLFTAPDGAVKVEVFFREEALWPTLKALAKSLDGKMSAINKHLKNMFESGELAENSVVSILGTTATDGKNYLRRYCSLDAIIAVAYRVNFFQAMQFRIWVSTTLWEFLIKSFVMEDKWLKQDKRVFGKDYVDELLEPTREIRSNERRFYQKITNTRLHLI